MKKLFVCFLFLFLFATVGYAKSGDVIGNIYSTDILATVNGVPVESFNIGGKTAIVLEDLSRLGMQVYYDDAHRTLLLQWRYFKQAENDIKRGTLGKVTGSIYESDIVTYWNGIPLRTFSLNGKMAAIIEEIGAVESYSSYGAKAIWDEQNRIIDLVILNNNDVEAANVMERKVNNRFIKGDKIYFNTERSSEDLNMQDEKKVLGATPIFYNDIEIGIKYTFDTLGFYEEDDSTVLSLRSGGIESFIWYDIEKLRVVVADFPDVDLFARAISYYINTDYGPRGVYKRFDTETYSFLYSWVANPHGKYEHLVRIGKDGQTHDYSGDLPTFNQYYKLISDVEIHEETETVTFKNDDKPYTINLKTGELVPEFEVLKAKAQEIAVVYSSDILATVNGVPMESFNIGGSTAIYLEDLKSLGAKVDYIDSLRTLNVDFTSFTAITTKVERGIPGKELGRTETNDIIVYYNGLPIRAFPYQGKMAVLIEELGKKEAFSPYGASFRFDNETRTIALTCLYDNYNDLKKLLEEKNIVLRRDVGDSFCFIPRYDKHRNVYYMQDNEHNDKADQSYDLNSVSQQYQYRKKNIVDGRDFGFASSKITFRCYDLEKISTMLNEFRETPSYDNILYFYTKIISGHVIKQFDSKDYTFLYIQTYLSDSFVKDQLLIKINKDGSYRDFAIEFDSVVDNGSRWFYDLSVNETEETVSFTYEGKPYTLDLKTEKIEQAKG